MKLPRSLSACSSSLREGSIIGLMLCPLRALTSTYLSFAVYSKDRAAAKTDCIVKLESKSLVELSEMRAARC